MRPKLILQPIHNSSVDILQSFASGKPLTSDQMRFLEWHQRELSSAEFDPVLKYYLEYYKKHHQKQYQATFLLPHEELNFEDIQRLKKRIKLFIQKNAHRVAIGLSQKQFLKFKEYNAQELIFWHGNQALTGAPYLPGGIPPVIFFQWGNLFGIVKYLILAEEKALRSNILIYFEDMADRYLEQCVIDYQQKIKEELSQQYELVSEYKIDSPTLDQFLIKPPLLRR